MENKHKSVKYPLTITWIPTRRCNLSCDYCKFRDNTAKEMSEDDVGRVIKIFNKHLPDRFICILGGDVTIWKGQRLENFVDELKDSYYGLQTNGILITDEYLQVLKDVGLKNLSLSLDPSSCGDRGDKEKAAGHLITVARKISIEDVHVTLTLDKLNHSNAVEMVKFIDGQGGWSEITPYIASPLPWYDFGQFSLKYAFRKDDLHAVQRTMNRLRNLKSEGFKIHTTDEYLAKFAENVCCMPHYKYRCSGMVNLVVDYDGSLRPCLHIRGDRMRKINIFDFENIENVDWASIIENEWADDVKEQCKGCFWDCQAELDWIYQKWESIGQKAIMTKVNSWFSHGA